MAEKLKYSDLIKESKTSIHSTETKTEDTTATLISPHVRSETGIVLMTGGIYSLASLIWSVRHFMETRILSFELPIEVFPANGADLQYSFILTQALGLDKNHKVEVCNSDFMYLINPADTFTLLTFFLGHVYVESVHEDIRNIVNPLPLSSMQSVGLSNYFSGRKDKKFNLYSPFADTGKSRSNRADVIAYIRNSPHSDLLAYTYSCIESANVPCGTCVKCIDRRDAFETSMIKDPLLTRLNIKQH